MSWEANLYLLAIAVAINRLAGAKGLRARAPEASEQPFRKFTLSSLICQENTSGARTVAAGFGRAAVVPGTLYVDQLPFARIHHPGIAVEQLLDLGLVFQTPALIRSSPFVYSGHLAPPFS